MNRMLVFVYGTLKSDKSAGHFLKDSKKIGEAMTVNKMALFEDSIPFVSPDFAVSPIFGECYEVNYSVLKKLDYYEGHPSFYCREEVPILTKDGYRESAWIYLNEQPEGILRLNGTFQSENKIQFSLGKLNFDVSTSEELFQKMKKGHFSFDPEKSMLEFVNYLQNSYFELFDVQKKLNSHIWLANTIDVGCFSLKNNSEYIESLSSKLTF